MNAAIRWRIIVLQAVALFVLVLGTVGAYAAYSFTNDQIHANSPRSRSSSPKTPPPACPTTSKPTRASRSSRATRRTPTPRSSSGCI